MLASSLILLAAIAGDVRFWDRQSFPSTAIAPEIFLAGQALLAAAFAPAVFGPGRRGAVWVGATLPMTLLACGLADRSATAGLCAWAAWAGWMLAFGLAFWFAGHSADRRRLAHSAAALLTLAPPAMTFLRLETSLPAWPILQLSPLLAPLSILRHF